MIAKPISNEIPYVLVISMNTAEAPYIHGYSSEEERDKAYEEFVNTGKLKLRDVFVGVEKEVEPIYVARFNQIDGTVNVEKLKEEAADD